LALHQLRYRTGKRTARIAPDRKPQPDPASGLFVVALPIEAVLGARNRVATYRLPRMLAGVSQRCCLRPDDHNYVRSVLFARAEAAQAFGERIGAGGLGATVEKEPRRKER
jgi:hypothetical protein